MGMDKERILAAARNEKYRGQEYENKECARSSMLSILVALIVGFVLFLLEYFIKGTVNTGLIAVGLTAAGVDSLYEGVKLNKVYLKIAGAIQLFIAVAAILAFVGQVIT